MATWTGKNATGATLTFDADDIGGSVLRSNVNVKELPATAATAANQTSGNASLTTIASAITAAKMQTEITNTPSVTVSGVATAANQTAGNASLTTIAGAISAAKMQAEITNTPSVTVSGVATAANQTTGNASLATLAGAVAGTEMQIDVVKAGSVEDANNTTTTPLGGSASFVGTGTDLLGYSTVCITLATDADSATDGMKFQFSTDNTNWHDSYNFTMDVSSSNCRRFQFPVTARYFRLNYTNGAGAQTYFRVQTILHTANQLTSVHRLDDDMSPDRSAQVVKSVLFAKTGGAGDFIAVDATGGGNLKVAVEEFGESLPAGTNNIGEVSVELPTVVRNGSQNATQTRATLAASQAVNGLISIKNLSTSVNTVYVGDSSVTDSNGYPLAPGECEKFEIDNINKLNVICATGETATVRYISGSAS